MKYALSVIVAGLMTPLSGFASQPGDMAGAKTLNGKVVVSYIDTLFNQHKAEQAFDNYLSRDYVEHGYLGRVASSAPPAPTVAPAGESDFQSGRAGAAEMLKHFPKMRFEIKKVLAQDDLVFVQAHGMNGITPNGDLTWLLYRLKGGKIIEHWDTHNPIPDDQVGKQW